MTSIDDIATNLQIFYQKILDIFQSKSSPIDKWKLIASYIHENNNIIVTTYKNLKKQVVNSDIGLDYNIDFNQINKQIAKESNNIIKCSTIILGLHIIVYDLMSQEGNYSFIFDGKKEMAILKKDIMYYVSISSKNEQNIFFHAFLLIFALESLFNKYLYVGIDFEYTNRKIQLAQLNFEHNHTDKSMILIVSPNELEPIMTDNFIDYIVCNKNIKKILHGSDSLDIPYMYNHLLQDDPSKIIKFTRSLIDTRFLCEYYKLTRSEPSDNKCSIYDEDSSRSAIYYFKVVSDDQQRRLAELLESMPSPHDRDWYIHKMPVSQVQYAALDVLYLKVFYYRMIYVATEDESTDLGKKNIMDLYKNVLNEITRFVYLERNNVTYLMATCKKDVDIVNNYFIRTSNGILKMIDIFNQVSLNLETTSPKIIVDNFLKINHFKTPVVTIIKRLVYGFISQKCRVYKDKSTLWTDKLENNFIFDFMEEMKFNHLLKMYQDLAITLQTRVNAMCSQNK
ncbi:hypothetical protein [Powai lake megavirus]|uniref:3'-5' exonuclease domain-containing protein n=1 Tax=Powai lake megavirus TaxID=1842663 RepID=A0A167RJA9_9VIRU|nr:hypothetical protein QJ849_gp589 [Powai lake megavirus]ANB50751.1 hypothetical protein [Powai lake megavirus]